MTKPYIPDLELYDSFLVNQFEDSCVINTQSLFEPLAAVYTRRKHIFTSLDFLYGNVCPEPFAFIEYLLYHRTGNKKRIRAILPVLDIELDRVPVTEKEKLTMAINYLYASTLAKIVLDPEREFKYTKLWYGCKNHIKEWDIKHNHLAMLAELAPQNMMILENDDTFLTVKALEKYGKFFEARGLALRYMYDNPADSIMVPLMVESVCGLHISTAKKTLDFVAPDTESFAIYGLRLGRNCVSIVYEPGRLSINTDRTLYSSIQAEGYEFKRLPIPADGSCTIKL